MFLRARGWKRQANDTQDVTRGSWTFQVVWSKNIQTIVNMYIGNWISIQLDLTLEISNLCFWTRTKWEKFCNWYSNWTHSKIYCGQYWTAVWLTCYINFVRLRMNNLGNYFQKGQIHKSRSMWKDELIDKIVHIATEYKEI